MALGQITDDARLGLGADRFAFWIFLFSLVSILAQVSLILVSWNRLPPAIPLFYSRPWGEPMLTSPIFLWILPAIGLAVTIVNFSLSIFAFSKNRFLTQVLVTFCLVVAFATLYDAVKIIGLLT